MNTLRAPLQPAAMAALTILLLCSSGCESMLNGYLDPTAVGSYSREETNEIRTSLSIQDPPSQLPGATEPMPEDLVPYTEEYRLTQGDFLELGIFELRLPGVEDRQQISIDELGMISIPIIGRLHAVGLTASELEREIADQLAQKEVLRDAQVRVNPLLRRGASYTLFGFFGNIQTGNRFGPGTSPIPAPDFRLLEALAISGGLDERVQEVWIYRKKKSEPPPGTPPPADGANPSLVSHPRSATDVRKTSAMTDLGAPRAMGSAVLGMQAPAPRNERPDQPTTQQNDTQELIEAVTGKSRQTSEPEEPTGPASGPAEAPPPSSAGKRWIFFNKHWVQVTDETVPATEPSHPVAPQRQAGPAGMPPMTEPPSQPTIDWETVAGVEDYRIIRIPAEPLGKLDPRYNIVVRPGDIIRLRAEVTGIYYMVGQVARAGAFGISAQKITMKAAIAAAGGLAPLAWPDRCTVYRRYGDREEMIQVNLDRIFSGREPDFYVKPDDIINVGSHPAAVFLATARNAFRMFYGFGFVYDRNFADIDTFGSKLNPDVVNERAQRFPGLFTSP